MPSDDVRTRRVFADLAALEEAARAGDVVRAAWRTIDQATIDTFAAATGDRQWIHLDAERARRESPYGTTIAHGFLTLSSLSAMIGEALEIASARMTVNYGFDRVRFVSPVPVGARIRGVFTVAGVTRTPEGARVTWDATVEIDGATKPALVARWISYVIESDARPGGATSSRGR